MFVNILVPMDSFSMFVRRYLVKVDGGAAVVGDVGVNVEVSHSNLAEVSGMVFVEVNPENSHDCTFAFI